MFCVGRKLGGILNSQKDSISPWKDEIPRKLSFFVSQKVLGVQKIGLPALGL